MSLVLRKAFDTVDHNTLFQLLGYHGIDPSYISLLKLLYKTQRGTVHGSRCFDIRRGVKQGDVLSTILFNCVLDVAFENWKVSLSREGLLTSLNEERLTNTRYADDILLYAKSLETLQHMAYLLTEELRKMGLGLSAEKNKNLTFACGRRRCGLRFCFDW